MTVAVALSDSPRGQAALRVAAEEAVLRGQDLAVIQIIPGVDEVLVNDPAIEERVAEQLAGVAGLTWKLYTAPRSTTPPRRCSIRPKRSTPSCS